VAVAKLTLEYDGTPFYGWAAQTGRRTVATELERALRTVLRMRELDLTVAGRTDRGVHALGQVVSYPGPLPALRSLNALLPEEISVTATQAMPDGFSARHDAVARTYHYRVHTRPAASPFERGRSLWWPYPVDERALQACAAALRGRHDFTAFTPTETYHERFWREVLAASWTREDDVLVFAIQADTFMRHMNRVLVGTMLEVAGGRRSVRDFERLLRGGSRSAAGATAPPHGLYLAEVRYQ
jgi:tRNA pseudouridine38-40 synthase